MFKPRISIALCTYNGARYLREQLESIAAQSRLPDELVVCDDGSKDETVAILRAFAERAPFAVRLGVNDKNLGSTKNFEKVIGLCEGEIIALADQDDVWKAQKLAVLEEALEEHPEAGYVFSDAELIKERGELLGATLWKLVGFEGAAVRSFSESRQVLTLLRRAAVTGATMAFRSHLKGILLPFSVYFAQDYWISLLASCVGSYGLAVPDRLILYRQHDGQQIGARRRSILQKVKWARRIGGKEYSNKTQWYRDMKERLWGAAARGRVFPGIHLDLLEEKIAHCSRREAAHATSGAIKLGKVLSELFTGRYGRFSNSWMSVVEDLCL